MNCSTVTSPDIPVTVSKLFVYNQVESADYQYLITCTRNWVGSKCTWMNVGESFEAEESGDTMNVYAYMSYNDQLKGKLTRVKFDIRNRTPKTSYQIATPQPPVHQPEAHPAISYPQLQSSQPQQTTIWNEEPTGFRGVNFGMTVAEAKAKETWIANDCPTLAAEKYCFTEHFIGDIKVKSDLTFNPGLASVLVEFSPFNFELMKLIFIEKYGKPHASRNEPRTGMEQPNEILYWFGKKVSVRLEKFPEKGPQSTAFITNGDSIKQSTKDAADDF